MRIEYLQVLGYLVLSFPLSLMVKEFDPASSGTLHTNGMKDWTCYLIHYNIFKVNHHVHENFIAGLGLGISYI